MKRHVTVLAATAALAALAGISSAANPPASRLVNVASLALPAPVHAPSSKLDPSLSDAQGEVDVVVQLAGAPLAIANGKNSRRVGGLLTPSQQRAHSSKVTRDQDATLARLLALGGREIARTRIATNAVIVRIDSAQLITVTGFPEVQSVRPVRTYQKDLSETVPYIGAAAAQAAGVTGAGVRVAVLDSGIDYTHRNLGGAGTPEAYAAAWGVSAEDPANKTLTPGVFPTAKVLGGYDFVGEVWPNGAVAPDPNPIDAPPTAPTAGGHGTHVSDIIAGNSADGLHKGVAPDAKLYAVKVCSAVATSCNGVAILQGFDFALDPNGDGDMEDAVDVINLSLGSSYGQEQDDSSFAAQNSVEAGVVVVVSAGNSADRPFITGSPASAPGAISVAQTQVPGAKAFPLITNSPASIAGSDANTATVEWAPLNGDTTGDIAAVPGLGCAPEEITVPVTGKIALIDRGTCSVSLKVDAAAKNGAIGVIIANNVAGDAPSFSFGGGDVMVPTLVVTQPRGNILRTTAATQTVNVTLAGATGAVPLVGSMVSTSSRGPNYSQTAIKPEIGAPGASVSAISSSGTGEEAFGGTSGAAPMVSGAAALLLSKNSSLTPTQVKALLVNTAEQQIYTNPATQPGVLAPITRIGGGEVRVNRALAASAAMWDVDTRQASLSFGYQSVSFPVTLKRTVQVRNFTNKARVFSVSKSFRFANDEASGAVTVIAQPVVAVGPRGTATFDVRLIIDPAKLPAWPWANGAGGSQGGNGPLLQNAEFDGFVTIADKADKISLPWHVLPKKSPLVQAVGKSVKLNNGSGKLLFANLSLSNPGQADPFALLGTSDRIPRSELPGPGDNLAVVDIQAVGARLVGIGGGAYGLQVAISTYGARAHPSYPAEFDVYVDTNGDGNDDYVFWTQELGTFASSGQTVVYVAPVGGAGTAYFYAITDLQASHAVLTVPLSALGNVSPAAKLRLSAYAFDNYFTGSLTDYVENMLFTPGIPKFDVTTGLLTVPARGIAQVNVVSVAGGATASPSQTGLLYIYPQANVGLEADAIEVKP